MKKIFMSLSLIFGVFFESSCMKKDATIFRIDIQNSGRKEGSLLVVDLPTKKPIRIFMFNGLLSTDLKYFSKSFECTDMCGGTKRQEDSCFKRFVIYAFDPEEQILKYRIPSYPEVIYNGSSPEGRYTGPIIDIKKEIEMFFGVIPLLSERHIADLSNLKSCLIKKNYINVREIISSFPKTDQGETVSLSSYEDGFYVILKSNSTLCYLSHPLLMKPKSYIPFISDHYTDEKNVVSVPATMDL
jgi:hypothetical protein